MVHKEELRIMLDKLRDILSRVRIRRNKPAPEKTPDTDSGGKVYALWLLVLPVMLGLVLGRLADVGLGYVLDSFTGTQGRADSAVTGSLGNAEDSSGPRGLDGFLAANPFHVSPQKPETPEPPKPVVEETPPEPVDTALEDVILRGTLPGVGGWFEKDGKLSLLLIGKSIDRYRLNSVKYNEAVFRQGRRRITKYIVYGPVAEKPKETPPPPKPTPAPAPAAQNDTGNVRAASETQEGEVPAEMVNSLVQNPFDELKRIRMRPNDKAGGLEVQWIQNDSILKRLGVQRGDVIKSVNGIPFTNMGDIANSINSLMNSERFYVEVTRGGKSTALRYVVR